MSVGSGKVQQRHFLGRRRGRRLSETKHLLMETRFPGLRIDPEAIPSDLRFCFSCPVQEVWLEIGFGSAEHLLWQAGLNPHIGFIGVEPFVNGLAKAVSGIYRDGLENVRLYDDDIWLILPRLPAGSVSRLFLFFPDPWCKARYKKRRLFSQGLVRELGRILVSGAELHLASDIPDYIDWMQVCLQEDGRFLARMSPVGGNYRPAGWVMTRYEKRAVGAGRQPVYLRFSYTGCSGGKEMMEFQEKKGASGSGLQ